MESRSEDLLMEKNGDRTREERAEENRHQENQIDVLPDDVLLEMFDFYAYTNRRSRLSPRKRKIETWQSLVHVCRRWRNLVFQSPRRLNLRLFCTSKTCAKDLDVWPALPLVVGGIMISSESSVIDNVIAALGQNNRVCQVDLSEVADRRLESVLAAMQVPFPELTDLRLKSRFEMSAIPDSFLGGSAPSLRFLDFYRIPFPGLPKLLLSATHLVRLWLFDIPPSGYMSPDSVIALISVLSSLESFFLEFEFPESLPDSQRLSLPTPRRSILPVLYQFGFQGVTEYLEELVTLIDTPQLNLMYITFFNQIDFDCPRVAQFIDRTPTLRALDEARVRFSVGTASVNLYHRTSQPCLIRLDTDISCRKPDRQFSFVERLCNSSFPPLSTVEDLYIEHRYWSLFWNETTLWLPLLPPFTAVKNLYLSKQFAPGIAVTLRELVGGGITGVLPNLQNIFVQGLEESGPVPENLGQFVAARQLSGHPIAISDWEPETNDSDTDSM